ncbi:hypothetical protein ACSBR2_007764 [Camellia fascicularis]
MLNSGFTTTISNSKLMGNETDRIIEDPLYVSEGHCFGLTFPGTGAHLRNLSFLRESLIQNNSFGNEIPPEIGRLPRLQLLQLSNNLIGGQIPVNICRCANLVYIDFSHNGLVGEVPVELGSLSKLEIVITKANNLTGSISPFANLSSLRHLCLDNNYFDGSIPDGFGRLKNLQTLALSINRLSGVIPASLFNHSSLTTFDVIINQIQGSLPWDLGIILPNLEGFSISENQFTGSISVSILNASKLYSLEMVKNKLTGKVPNLSRPQNLKWLLLTNNQLGSGEADDLNFIFSLINATNLHRLEVNINNFGCKFPEYIGNLSRNLEYLNLDNNHIFRNTPSRIVNLVGLQSLSMQLNQFTGTIPSEIRKLQNLHILNLDNNSLSGDIPSSLGNLSLLSKLALRINNFQGSNPPSLGNCNLSQNKLSGSLPTEVASLINLCHLDVSYNLLSSEIPSTLGHCTSLEMLRLGNNFFNGTIPSSLSFLRGLGELGLANNNLSGEIPMYLESFILLQNLNLSFNNFEGVVPTQGVFSNANTISVVGNSKLCGGVAELNLPKCNLKVDEKRRSNSALALALSIPFGFVGLALVGCVLYLCWFKKRRKDSPDSSKNLLLRVSYQTLVKATDGFSIFRSVYKRVIDGRIVTVKSFASECEALRNIGHRNLVKVLTESSVLRNISINRCCSLIYENILFADISHCEFVSGLMGNETDRLSLLAIKAKIVEDPLHVLSSWNDSIHFCQWQGVTCGRRHQRRVTALDLQSRELVGSISPHLGNLSFLRELLLQNNSFGNEIPPEIGRLPRLQILQLSNNLIGGQIPVNISRCANLIYINFSHNGLVGEVPVELGSLSKLAIVNIEVNQLTGTIPSGIGNLQNLHELNLLNNSLSGNIPSSLGNLSLLSKLVLGLNNFQGNIPPSLGNCSNLQKLFLSQNNLNGTIPKQVVSISSLSIYLDLSQNQLSGSLPMEVAKLINLGYLDVSKNLLSGEIPSTLGSCTSLETLRLGNNFFNGTIPSSLSFLRGLSELDLANNSLSGEIPVYLESFILLQNLNLSFNNFEGVVPTQGVFCNVSKISVVRNSKLCGGVAELKLPKCNFKFRNRRKDTHSDSSKNSLLRVSYQTLVKATDGFSSFNLIGVGSFGSVYKGVIDGRIVAVKVLNLLRHGASKSFVSECEALRNIRHRNLVKVLTACSTVDYQGHDFKALIYEFMVNGSLEEWLHPNPNEDLSNEEFRKLNLFQRLNIVIDIVCALNYLHNQGQTPIVHCDLKPSNILLDKDMTGHVGDFGLAKFLADHATHDLSTSETRFIGIRGTIGYTAPEYGMGSEILAYGDIYGFGILMLEMFTGKRPTDEIFKDGLSLHSFVKEALPGSASEISDPILFQTEGEEEEENSIRSEKIVECLSLILEIGVNCSSDLPRERMEINDVAAKLHFIKDALLGSEIH